MEILILILLALNLALVAYFVFRLRETPKDDSRVMLMLQHQMQNLSRATEQRC